MITTLKLNEKRQHNSDATQTRGNNITAKDHISYMAYGKQEKL